MPVIGFLGSASPDLWAHRMRTFHQGLGRNWVCRWPQRRCRSHLLRCMSPEVALRSYA